MNDERNESSRRLLNDVLREGPNGLENEREAALTAFRRGRLLRRAGRASLAVMMVAVATAGVLVLQRHIIHEIPPVAVAKLSDSQPAIPTLTDEELIASFPSNSCFLAEVEGRPILVFVDPSVEQEVLHKGKLASVQNP